MCGSSSTTRMRSGFPRAAGAGAASGGVACDPLGSSIVNVAPEPGLVSSVMRPPCSCTIPWQIDRPSPVPLPSPLVVKNGSNTRAATSSDMPGPESVTLTATPSRVRFAVIQIPPLDPSLVIAWLALLMRFTNTCLIWLAFTSTSGRPGSTASVASILVAISWLRSSASVDSRIGSMGWRLRSPSWLRANDSRFFTIVAARSASWRMTWSGSTSRGGSSSASTRKYENPTTEARGLFRSCATPAISCPIADIFSDCINCSWSRRRSVWSSNRSTAEPGAAGDRRHRLLHQVGEDAVGAAHHAVGVDDADGLRDRVDRLLPFALRRGEQLHQPGVLERDGRLGQHGRDERDLRLAERAGTVRRERHRPHGAAGRDERRADPGAGRRLAQHGTVPPGLFPDVLREKQRPAPQRELQEGVVRAGGDGVGVVGHREPVGFGI